MTPPKVLVIDDDVVLAELIVELLRLESLDAHAVHGGGSGIETVRTWRPDALVLDLMLPDIDGVEVCRLLRDDPATRDLGILLLTAKIGDEGRRLGFDAGVDAFLTKPFEPGELCAEVRALLDRPREAHAPRRVVEMRIGPADEASSPLHHLTATLLRSTPLAVTEIERIDRGLSKLLGPMLEGAPTVPFSATFCVFDDRLECWLRPESEVHREALKDLSSQARRMAADPSGSRELFTRAQLEETGKGSHLLLVRVFD